MRFKCKEPGCTANVTYIPREIDLGTAFSVELQGENKLGMERARFDKAVTNIVNAKNNDYNETKAIFLNCDNSPSHTHSYQIPTK